MCSAKKIFLSCLCVVSSFVFALHSSASYAVSQDVVFYGSATATFDVYYTGGTLSCTGGCNYTQNTHADTNSNVNTVYLSLPSGTFQSDTIFRYDLNIFKVNSSASLHAAFNSLQVASVSSSIFSVYDIEYQQLDTNSTMVSIYLKLTQNNISFSSSSQVVLNSSTPYPYNYILTLNPSERISGAMRYHFSIANDSAGTQAIVNAINNTATDYTSNLNTINNSIGSVNNNLNQVNNNLNDVQDSIDQSNQDANDRYQDEKDTINDNGDNANSSWTDNTDNLKFQPPTFLFNWFWSLGTTDQCIDISTLASLIHSNETQYCSWYPTNIRSIISPIINIFLVCFISGFIIKWLKKDGI